MRRTAQLAAVALASIMIAPFALAAAEPGQPTSKPPRPAKAGGPPAAWIESTQQSAWLAYGSFCWTTGCADYLAPALRAGIRVLYAARGTTVRIHFGFSPQAVTVGYIKEASPPHPLSPGRVVLWHPRSSGRFELQTHAAQGTASYIGSIALTG
jgi:hypothetical protein